MAVVDVVHMVAVRHRHMTAPRTVLVSVAVMDGVAAGLALVHTTFMRAMQMAVVDIVDVVVVRHRYMAAPKTVLVSVVSMDSRHCGFRSHSQPLLSPTYAFPSPADAPRRLCQTMISDCI
ncbi:hypothetical protein BIV25_14705 [Streptomyces sp. MUSC 14]|nr:hypothetical protein BIV25_14705 [Streptomyces sp. MUSC 14]